MKRLLLLDGMCGIAMLLVITGHLLAGFAPVWYTGFLRPYIYSFHMGLFFFISGFLIRYNYRPVATVGDYRQYLGRRFRKFVPSIFLIGCVILLINGYLRNFDIKQFMTGLWFLCVAPRQSYSGFLWYIYLLFIFYALTPILVRMLESQLKYPLWGVALFLAFFPCRTEYFAADHFCRFLIFLLLGFAAARNWKNLSGIPTAFYFPAMIPFVLWSVYFCYSDREPYCFWASLLAIPACAAIVIWLVKIKWVRNVLQMISINCFAIYLFHMFVIGIGAFLANRLHFFGSFHFFLYMLALIPAAIFFPVLINRGYRYYSQRLTGARNKLCNPLAFFNDKND